MAENTPKRIRPKVKISTKDETNLRLRSNLYTYQELRDVCSDLIRLVEPSIKQGLKKTGVTPSVYGTIILKTGEASVRTLVNILRGLGFKVRLYVQVTKPGIVGKRPFIHKRYQDAKAETDKKHVTRIQRR